MRIGARALAVMAVVSLWAVQSQAQTADEIIEKHLAAIGGRAALAKVQTAVATGTVSVSAQGAELSGPLEVYHKAPNKSRSYFKMDMSQFGMGEMVVDQRCDGKTAFATNTMQGDREITGDQLQAMLDNTFPSSYLTYKEAGTKVELKGKEKLGERDAYVIIYTPKAGPASKQYFDAENYLLVRAVTTMNIPELGGATEQTSDMSDYKEVGGVKMPFTIRTSSSMQSITIALQNIEVNKPLEDAMFTRPAAK